MLEAGAHVAAVTYVSHENPSRELEYVVLEGLALVAFSAYLLLAVLVAGVITLYFRWLRGNAAGTLLLLPSWRKWRNCWD